MAKIPEPILNAEMEAWNRLEAKVKEAVQAARGLRFSGPHGQLSETLKNVRQWRDYVKGLHDDLRKLK